MKTNILIVEDEQKIVDELRDSLEEAELEFGLDIMDFDGALESIGDKAPDVLILDVYEGKPNVGEAKGKTIYDTIWEKNFVPLIFASASIEEDLVQKAESHPLMHYLCKNEENFYETLVAWIKKFIPIGAGIREIKMELCEKATKCAQSALVNVAPHAIGLDEPPENSLAILKSVAGRRLAAQMLFRNEKERGEIFAWERYIYPPVANHLLTGDILKSVKDDGNDSESFRVILTPSCDLAQGKTDVALAACCVKAHELWSKCDLTQKRDKALSKGFSKIRSILSRSQESGYKLLPAYAGLIPHMAICFRKLEVLKISENGKIVSLDGTEYRRVVSMDSPFREQLTWAYLEVAGRIGVPDQDMNHWIRGVMDEIDPPSRK